MSKKTTSKPAKPKQQTNGINELLNELVKQNIQTNQRIDATNNRIDATMQLILSQNQTANQRIDSALQRIDDQNKEMRKIQSEFVEKHDIAIGLFNEVIDALERLPGEVKEQIGFQPK